MNFSIKPTAPSAHLIQLLAASNLPVADLSSSESLKLFGACMDNELVGAVGLELYPPVALLRSLAVAPEHRGSGLGKVLLGVAEKEAAALGVGSIYLLTTGASGFFSAFGYAVVERDDAPTSIRATAQFSGLCPATSLFMVKHLRRRSASAFKRSARR